MNQLTTWSGYMPFLPEIVLAAGSMLMLMAGVTFGERSGRVVNSWCVLVLVAAAVATHWVPAGRLSEFGGSFLVDDFARFLKLLTLAGSAGALLLSLDWLSIEKQQRFEYCALFILSTLGMMMLISAGDLIALYLGLELMSLALYVVASSNRENLKSTEAGLKYFVLGALSSGMLLYGASLIYGFTGTVSFIGIAKATHTGASIGLIFGLVFLFVGFCFKISAVPFHMWTPDVYEGAPSPVTAFFASAPKVAAIAIFVRATITAFPGITHEWQQIVVFVSILSMALGSFAVILAMRRQGVAVENISDLAGLARTHPTMAFLFAMLMFSLAGIPPLAGFFAKFYVFLAAINAGLYALAVIGVLSSVVGAYYYLMIVKTMYFDDPVASFDRMPGLLRLVLLVSGVINLLFFAWPAPILGAATAAAKSLF